MKLAVFDVCGTLFRCNTLFTFIRWKGGLTGFADSFAIKILDSLMRPLGLPLRRALYIRSLRGADAAEIKTTASEFVNGELFYHTRLDAFEFLFALRCEGWRVVLLSGSAEEIIQPLAEFLGVEYISSTLEQKNGKLTGRFDDCIAGAKHEMLTRFSPYDRLLVCTDNRDDLALVRLADERRIYCQPKFVRFWRLHGIPERDLIVEERNKP